MNRKIVNLKLELVEIVVHACMTFPSFYISFLVEFSFFHVFLLSAIGLIPLKDFFKTLSMPCYHSLCFVVQNSLTYFSSIRSPKLVFRLPGANGAPKRYTRGVSLFRGE